MEYAALTSTHKTDFDGAYHRIFSQPEVVKELVRRFLPAEVAGVLELDRLQRDDLQCLRDIARAFIAFITEVLTPRGLHITNQHIQHIHEAKPMLKQTVERWRQELAVQHQEIGEARGKEIGKEIGELRSLLLLFQHREGRPPSAEEREQLLALLQDEGLEVAMQRLLAP